VEEVLPLRGHHDLEVGTGDLEVIRPGLLVAVD